ncbi:AIPR family protein [Elizabethkingia ursingii]|uniref:AIPR family protein n=1 Tax=Elizabethkingia ursingii TaxID=1756150 RepID=UPI002011D0CB|nr:AIPR family protein [Elizabethkingia ursingii]MCL1665118.1 AIPR family protein [Elizabethkingia ursingii]
MAKNDKILIDGIIDERIELKIPSDKRDEVFEYFAFEQILKDYDLSDDEIKLANVDGRNDGGIDGFFIFVNGHLLTEIEKFNWPKSGCTLDIYIITCKHHDTFRQAPLDNLVASITELFDLSLENEELQLEYSENLMIMRDNFKYAYRKISPRLSDFKINFCYASRGNSEEIGESISSRANQIKKLTNDSFGNCKTDFIFIGSSELVELHRKAPNFTLELPFSDDLSNGQTYVVLVKLKDYYNFITDSGKLRRYLFDSNVRDFMGLNNVNEDIRSTLNNDDSPDFWWLNNGVTILATGAGIIGKAILIEDIQIVNGLQTSESIFRYFDSGQTDTKNRSVLVKVIVSNDIQVRDEIIRATNNQTLVTVSALHATDKIQRDIEEVLKLNDFYYERRTNFYKNQGIPINKIITPLYLASGFISLVLKAPEQASLLKSKFMRNDDSYNQVFSSDVDLQVWPKIAYILKFTDEFLETKRPSGNGISEYFLKYRRQVLSFITVARIFKDFNFSTNAIVMLDLNSYNLEELEKSWNEILPFHTLEFNRTKLNRYLLLQLCEKISESENIKNFERLKRNYGLIIHLFSRSRNKVYRKNIDAELLNKIDSLLPPQPWKVGIHKVIAKQLDCKIGIVYQAIDELIKSERRFIQKDGILYNSKGELINQA